MPSRTYVAILRKTPRTNYRVDFPDFPDCTAGGVTREAAEQHAAEALALHIESLRRDRKRIPPPTAVDTILDDPEHEDGEPFSVTVEVGA
jgi:predicted RNase H-like HicB family nuclease